MCRPRPPGSRSCPRRLPGQSGAAARCARDLTRESDRHPGTDEGAADRVRRCRRVAPSVGLAVGPGRSERACRCRPRGGRPVPEPGTDRQPGPQTLEPAQAPEAQHQEDEAKARPRDSVREALEPRQRPSGLRGRRSVWPTDRFHHARRDRVREARCDGRPRAARRPKSGQERCHRGHLPIDVGGAVPEDLTGDFAGGTKAEQPAQRCRASVEADRHAAKRLELYQLRPGRLRQALGGAIRIGEQRRHSERRSDQAARRRPIHQDPGASVGQGGGHTQGVGHRRHAARVPPLPPRRGRVVPAHAAPRARLLVHGVPEDRGRDVEVGPGIEQVLRPKPEHRTPDRIVDLREPDVRPPANGPDQERPPPLGSAGRGLGPECSAPRVGRDFRPRPPIPGAPGRSRPRPPPSPQFPRGLQAVPVQLPACSVATTTIAVATAREAHLRMIASPSPDSLPSHSPSRIGWLAEDVGRVGRLVHRHDSVAYEGRRSGRSR